jgi:stage II sporulation protein D
MRLTPVLIFTFFMLSFSGLSGMEVTVSLYNERSISSLVFSPVSGKYILIADGRQLDSISVSDPVYMTIFGEFIMLSMSNGNSGIYRHVHFGGGNETSEFRIRPLHAELDTREYHGSVTFSVEFMRMKIINRVNLEYYIAAVVEAEAGNNARQEFYKAQASICRTYALKHLSRHRDEGFNLCDEVHCQVYKGRLRRNPLILEATLETRGIVIIDKDSMLITGAFHANCGGQTVNSEDVWVSARSYLRSVIDPYCVKKNNRAWEKKIPSEDWKNYLVANGFKISLMNLALGSFKFDQKTRVANYAMLGDTLPFSKIRNDWRFRSAFFSVEINSNDSEIIIKGKGYGHGIGMCQEGAMQMAVEGKNWQEIISFYFQRVSLIDYTKVRDFRF